MHNQNVNVVRRSVREGISATVDEASLNLMARGDAAGVLEMRDLDRALARIPDEQRQVILLIGLEGTSYEKAAAILGIPIGTVRSRLSRGRETLRNLIDRGSGAKAIGHPAQNSDLLPA
jgi:RNA polymerase sigma-70 factor (ECF subfamily)